MSSLLQPKLKEPKSDIEGKIRLLVIDGDPIARRMIKNILLRSDYEITLCSSAAEGIKHLSMDHFDCVITDAATPGATRIDLIRAIRRHPRYGQIPILMVTLSRTRQEVKAAMDAGVTDYVLKPIDEALFLEKIELCLKKRVGKGRVFELPLSGSQAAAELGFACKMTLMSEASLTVRVPFPIPSGLRLVLQSPIFKEIGIETPLLQMVKCEIVSNTAVTTDADMPFEATFAFVGVPEGDLRKIRAWLQREEIRRKK